MSPLKTCTHAIKNVAHPGWANLSTFLVLLLVAIGNWGLNLGTDITFQELLTPFNLFSLMAVVGTTAGAYNLKAPKKIQ